MSALQDAIAAGLNYLLSMQAQDGAWTEWALPPGPSSAWTTAYVGYQLRSLAPDLMKQAAPHLTLAAHWQCEHAFAEGGWGYNERVGPDADSTSYAILFLASVGWLVPDSAYAMLAELQRPDGGFATYLPLGEPTSWNVSHPDVTPMALLAMLTQPTPDRALVERGIDYVLQQRTPQGLWHSFWWRSGLYGTRASLSLLDAVEIKTPPSASLAGIVPTNAFEMALLISSLLLVDRAGSQSSVGELVDRLIRQQRPDGSWESAPILRVTRRDCYTPWDSDDAGQLYAEPSRLFTTATVLHALTGVQAPFAEGR
jgi:squalene-hopene/tetraprenyl-beta-curcumene cyclase